MFSWVQFDKLVQLRYCCKSMSITVYKWKNSIKIILDVLFYVIYGDTMHMFVEMENDVMIVE